MAAWFVGDTQIVAGFLPFNAVWSDAAFSRPMLRQEMGQFVSEGALNFFRPDFLQTRIEVDGSAAVTSHARRAAQTGIPLHRNAAGQDGRACCLKQPACDSFQRGIRLAVVRGFASGRATGGGHAFDSVPKPAEER